jgi:hypothetical protein
MTLSNRRKVPPYMSSPATTWSPALSSCITVVVAARPEPNARPKDERPLSSAATARSSA